MEEIWKDVVGYEGLYEVMRGNVQMATRRIHIRKDTSGDS